MGAVGGASILMASTGARPGHAAEAAEKLAIDGGTPVRTDALHSQPYGPQFYDDVEKQELLEVLESKSPFRWWGDDSKVASVRESLRDPPRRQTRPRGDLGNDGAVHRHGGPGDRARRRSHPARLDLVRRLRRHRPFRRPAGVRRDRRVAGHRSGGHRAPDHAAHQGDRPQQPSGRRGRHGPDHRDRPQAQAPRAGRLLPVRRRTLQREVPGLDRRHRHQQLPTRQDHHLGRGRRRGQQRSQALRAGRPLPRRRRDPLALHRGAQGRRRWRPSPRATSA